MYRNIEAERGRAMMSKTELAEYLGVSRYTYDNYIKGKRPIPSAVLVVLSSLFGVSTDYLLGLKEDRS